MFAHYNIGQAIYCAFKCSFCSMQPLKHTDLIFVHVPQTGDIGKITEKTMKVLQYLLRVCNGLIFKHDPTIYYHGVPHILLFTRP